MNCNAYGKRLLNLSTRYYSNVGFVGLGQMGRPMAQNLLSKGVDLIVYDVNSSSTKEFPKIARSIQDLCQNSSIIITMLPNGDKVQRVYEDHDGILASANKKSLLIDCSTIEFDVAQKLNEKAKKMDLEMVDAPVSGGVLGATNGTLSFMVGGSTESYKRVISTLKHMGKNFFHCGSSGSGQIAKMCNNMLLGITMIGLSEAMVLGKRLGVDPEILTRVINASSGSCWSSQVYNPVPGVSTNAPASRNYDGGFTNELIAKDLSLAIRAAKIIGLNPKMGESAMEIYKNLSSQESSKLKDFSIIYQKLQQSTS